MGAGCSDSGDDPGALCRCCSASSARSRALSAVRHPPGHAGRSDPARPGPAAPARRTSNGSRKGSQVHSGRSDPARPAAGSAQVDFILADRTRIRAQFDEDCPALDFYGGFYLQPEDDGCARRDAIHRASAEAARSSASSSSCPSSGGALDTSVEIRRWRILKAASSPAIAAPATDAASPPLPEI